MNELLKTLFTQTLFTPDMGSVLWRGYILLQRFDYPNLEEEFSNILSRYGDAHLADSASDLVSAVTTRLTDILKSHGLLLSQQDLVIRHLVECVNILLVLQDVDDHGVLEQTLLSDSTPMDKIATIFSNYGNIEPMTVMEMFDSVDDSLLVALYAKYAKYTGSDEEPIPEHLGDVLKAYRKYIVSADIPMPIGLTMLEHGIRPGIAIDAYIGYIPNILITEDPVVMAHMVLSMVMLSYRNEPLTKGYFEVATLILKEETVVEKIRPTFTQIANDFMNFLTLNKIAVGITL